MLVGTIPHVPSNWRRIVKVHTHTLFLTTLTCKDIGRYRLLNFGFSNENFLFSLQINGLDLNDLPSADHTNVVQHGLDVVVREDHSDKRAREGSDTSDVVLRGPCFHKRADSSRGKHAMGDCALQIGII